MARWSKSDWNDGNRYVVTDGILQFDVHQLIDGRPDKTRARHPDGRTIVSPEEAEEYATKIVAALNAADVKLDSEQ